MSHREGHNPRHYENGRRPGYRNINSRGSARPVAPANQRPYQRGGMDYKRRDDRQRFHNDKDRLNATSNARDRRAHSPNNYRQRSHNDAPPDRRSHPPAAPSSHVSDRGVKPRRISSGSQEAQSPHYKRDKDRDRGMSDHRPSRIVDNRNLRTERARDGDRDRDALGRGRAKEGPDASKDTRLRKHMTRSDKDGRALPHGWQLRHSTESGKPYYYNTVTKKSQWSFPTSPRSAPKPRPRNDRRPLSPTRPSGMRDHGPPIRDRRPLRDPITSPGRLRQPAYPPPRPVSPRRHSYDAGRRRDFAGKPPDFYQHPDAMPRKRRMSPGRNDRFEGSNKRFKAESFYNDRAPPQHPPRRPGYESNPPIRGPEMQPRNNFYRGPAPQYPRYQDRGAGGYNYPGFDRPPLERERQDFRDRPRPHEYPRDPRDHRAFREPPRESIRDRREPPLPVVRDLRRGDVRRDARVRDSRDVRRRSGGDFKDANRMSERDRRDVRDRREPDRERAPPERAINVRDDRPNSRTPARGRYANNRFNGHYYKRSYGHRKDDNRTEGSKRDRSTENEKRKKNGGNGETLRESGKDAKEEATLAEEHDDAKNKDENDENAALDEDQKEKVEDDEVPLQITDYYSIPNVLGRIKISQSLAGPELYSLVSRLKIKDQNDDIETLVRDNTNCNAKPVVIGLDQKAKAAFYPHFFDFDKRKDPVKERQRTLKKLGLDKPIAEEVFSSCLDLYRAKGDDMKLDELGLDELGIEL